MKWGSIDSYFERTISEHARKRNWKTFISTSILVYNNLTSRMQTPSTSNYFMQACVNRRPYFRIFFANRIINLSFIFDVLAETHGICFLAPYLKATALALLVSLNWQSLVMFVVKPTTIIASHYSTTRVAALWNMSEKS